MDIVQPEGHTAAEVVRDDEGPGLTLVGAVLDISGRAANERETGRAPPPPGTTGGRAHPVFEAMLQRLLAHGMPPR